MIADLRSKLRDQRKRFVNWIDAFWGYDVFIAHRRKDAGQYAQNLYDELKLKKISCFIDRAVYGPGDYLVVATKRHIVKSTLLVLLGSPEILVLRKPIDWVEKEINEYLASHETDPKIVPVDFGETIANASLSAPHPILARLEPFVRIPEPLSSLAGAPSDAVLDAIRKKLEGRRRDRMRLRFFEACSRSCC
jgi:hypothetical protein